MKETRRQPHNLGLYMANGEAAANTVKTQLTIWKFISFVEFAIFAVSFLFWALLDKDQHSGYVIILLFIILVFHLLFYIVSGINFNLLQMLFCNTFPFIVAIGSTVFAICNIHYWWLGLLCFAVSVVAVIGISIFLMTDVGELFDGDGDPQGETRFFKIPIDKRFFLLLFGLASFLSVMILIGNTLLFHDQSAREDAGKEAGYTLGLVKNFNNDKFYIKKPVEKAEGIGTTKAETTPSKTAKESKADQKKSTTSESTIHFNEGSALISHDKANAEKAGCDGADTYCKNNSAALTKIVEQIFSAQENNKELLIVVTGKASDKDLRKQKPDGKRDIYSSNLELSLARATRTVAAIMKLVNQTVRAKEQKIIDDCKSYVDTYIKDGKDGTCTTAEALGKIERAEKNKKIDLAKPKVPRIIWQTVAASYDTKECTGPEKSEDKKCWSSEITLTEVENSSKEVLTHLKNTPPFDQNKLDILDYIYFSMYTLTTTGYGDIVPISAWARFVTIIANLYELIYTVLLFNVILLKIAGHNQIAGHTQGGGPKAPFRHITKPKLITIINCWLAIHSKQNLGPILSAKDKAMAPPTEPTTKG